MTSSSSRSGRLTTLGEPLRERLRTVLDREAVASASVFGSHGRGTAGPRSDIDIAIWANPRLDAGERHALRLELMREITPVIGGNPTVDVIVLDDAPPVLRHRAWRDGQLLVERDAPTRIRGQARTLIDYLDTQPLREQTAAGVRHRLAEGRFGRR